MLLIAQDCHLDVPFICWPLVAIYVCFLGCSIISVFLEPFLLILARGDWRLLKIE